MAVDQPVFRADSKRKTRAADLRSGPARWTAQGGRRRRRTASWILSVRGEIPEQMDEDAQDILEAIQSKYGGELPFTDKADPERIKQEFGMSKAAFKRAVGRLLKEGKIEITEESIKRR